MYDQAIIVISGAHPSAAHLVPHIQKNHIVICADGGYDTALALNLAPRVVIGDNDSITAPPPPGITQIPHSREKNYTDTELALIHSKEYSPPNTLLVGGGAGRFDHSIALLWLFNRPTGPADLITRWITDTAIIDHLTPTGTPHISLPTAPQQIISIFPTGPPPWDLQSTGLRWPLEDTHWHPGDNGVSNYATGTQVDITVKTGRILVVRAL